MRSLRRETIAANALLSSLADILDGDEELRDGAIAAETNLNEAMDAAIKRLLELNALMDGVAGLMDGLKARGQRLEKQHEAIRECLAMAMEVSGQSKIETPVATFFLKAKPAKAEIVNEADIPARFWKPQDPKLDKKSLLDALKAKEVVPGATLSNGGVSLQINVR